VRTTLNWDNKTAYFRNTFTLPGAPDSVRIRPFIDDGMVLYVNGVEVYRIGMPAGTPTYATFANRTVGTADFEGPFDIPAEAFVSGENVVAVQVHQQSSGSSDLTFALEMIGAFSALSSDPVSITVQPSGGTFDEGETVTLRVTAVGEFPILYKWFRNSVEIEGQTSSTLTLANAKPSQSGNYTVEVTNPQNTVTSQMAAVTIRPDQIAPAIVSALASHDLITITIQFSELINPASVNPANLGVAPSAGGAALTIESFTVDGTELILTTSPRTQAVDYTVTLSGITDLAETPNAIPANSQVLPRFQVMLLDVAEDKLWKYDDAGLGHGPEWRGVAFNDSAWKEGPALFLATTATNLPTVGEPIRTVMETATAEGVRIYTYYFRSTFTVPEFLAGVPLRIRPIVDDGAVFYVDGAEVFRLGMPAAPAEITYTTGATRTQGTAQLYEGPYTTEALLNPGQRVIAVEVHQVLPSGAPGGPPTSSDVAFAVQLYAEVASFEGVTPGPEITATRSGNNIVLSWNVPGFTLQQTSSLTQPIQWTDVPGTSPVTVPTDGGQRYFRLISP
jgi:hypothetical protein